MQDTWVINVRSKGKNQILKEKWHNEVYAIPTVDNLTTLLSYKGEIKA